MTELGGGNLLTLLESGREYFPALEAACDEAQHEIHIETYIFEDDAAGQRVAEALKRAARRGVATHLLVDGYGSKRLCARFIEDLKAAGVKFLVYRPDISPWRSLRQSLRRRTLRPGNPLACGHQVRDRPAPRHHQVRDRGRP